jgi:thymidylate kinase
MERFESIDELSKTFYKALDLVSYGRWKIIDGDRSIHEIQEEILEVTGLKPQPT